MYYMIMIMVFMIVSFIVWLEWLIVNIIAVAKDKEVFNLPPFFRDLPTISEPITFTIVAAALACILLLSSLVWFLTLPVVVAIIILTHIKKNKETESKY